MPLSDSERDLLARTQVSDPGAATPLYDRFASGIRALIRHHLPGTDPSTGVFHTLITVAHALRQGQIRADHQLVSQVRAAAKAFIEQSRGAPAPESRRPIHELPGEFARLDSTEREILTRFYRLGQTEKQISHETEIPLSLVRGVRRKIRQRYLIQPQR